MGTHVVPTFLLRGINPQELLADYHKGVFSGPPANKSQIQIAQNVPILAPTYGMTNHDPIFAIRDKNNCSVIIATSGHRDYEVFTSDGNELPVGGRCGRCHTDFTHRCVGYPIGFLEQALLVADPTDATKGTYRTVYTFWTDGRFCSFECALGYLQQILAWPCDYRDTTVRDSERLLKYLFLLTYPDAECLRPSQDPQLMTSNGGSLTDEQWRDKKHVYLKTDRVLMIPAKFEYVRQNFSN